MGVKVPKYLTIKQDIINIIKSNSLSEDDKIFSESEITKIYNVSSITAKKALNELAAEGHIYRIRGKGSFVSNSSGSDNTNMRLIACVFPEKANNDASLFKIIAGAQHASYKNGYSFLLESSEHEISKEHKLLNDLSNDSIKGVILFSIDPEKDKAHIINFINKNIPFVFVDRYTESFPCNTVTVCNTGGSFKVTEHLIKYGHKKILFAAEQTHLNSVKQRYMGFTQAFNAYSISDEGQFILEDTRNQLDRLLNLIVEKKITGIVFVSDSTAFAAINYLKKFGINIPDDVSAVGFDNIYTEDAITSPLTTVYQNFYKIGETATNVLIENINNPNLSPQQIFLPVDFIDKFSVKNLNNVNK